LPAQSLRAFAARARRFRGTRHAVPDRMTVLLLAVLAWWLFVPPLSGSSGPH
jgi:hypothetical protein